MKKNNIKKIPRYVWGSSVFILVLSLYLELFTSISFPGLFWLLNLISVSFISYHLGVFGGFLTLFLLVAIRIGVIYHKFSYFDSHELYLLAMVNILGITISLSIGYIAWKLKSNEKRIREIFNNNDITFWSRNTKTGRTIISEGYAKIYDVSREYFEENSYFWFDSIHPDDKQQIVDAIQKQNKGERTKLVYRIHHPDGGVRWLEDRGSPILNKKGQVTRVDGVVFDITSAKMIEEKMHHMAYEDVLTGLPNRNLFYNYVNDAIKKASRKNSTIAIMFIDFDNFKQINDTLGHSGGDLFLKQIADRLQNVICKGETVSRQSGDEFLILVENTSVNAVEAIAKQIIHGLNQPYIINGIEIHSTPSVGISILSDEDNAETLIDKADFAMYLAKERGKNNYQFYDDELNQKMKRKTMLDIQLRKAIEKEELSVYLQPQIDIKTGHIAGAEALIRWECDLGKISPGEFIPIAEETGLIIEIGEWVLQESCRLLRHLSQNHIPPFPISVNLSTKQLIHPHFIDHLKKIIDMEQITPSLLTLEITERAFLDYADAEKTILELRKMGVGVSLDDFGTGFSSLSMIKNIDIDELKIDRSFLSDALENKRVYSLLETIIQIGKNLNAKVVVEGIETMEQHQLLKPQGVYGQGYLYSRPYVVSINQSHIPIKNESWGPPHLLKNKKSYILIPNHSNKNPINPIIHQMLISFDLDYFP